MHDALTVNCKLQIQESPKTKLAIFVLRHRLPLLQFKFAIYGQCMMHLLPTWICTMVHLYHRAFVPMVHLLTSCICLHRAFVTVVHLSNGAFVIVVHLYRFALAVHLYRCLVALPCSVTLYHMHYGFVTLLCHVVSYHVSWSRLKMVLLCFCIGKVFAVVQCHFDRLAYIKFCL